MKDDIPKNLPENGHSVSDSRDSIDDLVQFASQHFATGFPNPEQIDCPPSDTYSDLITRKELPGEQLQAHLRSCSECFRNYRSLLEAQRKPGVLKPDWTPVSWYKRVLRFGLVVVFICFASYGLYRLYHTRPQNIEPPSVSQQRQESIPPPPNNPTPVSPNKTDQTSSAERTKPAPSPSRSLVAANTVAINFGRQRISRSGSQDEIPSVMFVAGLNRVNVRLTPGSPKGEYSLTLHDPFGKALKPPVVGMFDGRALRAELDLNSISTGKYLICIVRAAEVPDCLPAQVNTK